jgi:hypothetical protein
MLKTVILVLFLLGPRTAHSNDAKPHEVNGKAEAQQRKVDPPPVEDPAKSISTTHNSYYEHEPSKPKRGDPQWWSVWVNGAIALTTFGTLLYLRGQIGAIRNIERAFLVPVWENVVWQNPEAENGVPSHCFQWKFKNCGKTPAFLREVVAHMVILDSLDELPKNPDYSGRVEYMGDPLIGGEMMTRNFYSPLKNDPRDFEAIQEEYRIGAKVLFAYGMVRYDDMFGNSHETRFGVKYNVSPYSILRNEFLIDGPKRYNRYR